MNVQKIITLAGALLLCLSLNAQKKKAFKKQASPIISMDSLRVSYQSDPLNTIERLSQVIEEANNNQDIKTLYDANCILGEINLNEGFIDLAITRFKQALHLEQQLNNIDITISEQLGKAFLQSKAESATDAFTLCLEYSNDTDQKLRCQEGLANAYFKQGNNKKASEILESLENEYENSDKNSLPRVQAMMSQVAEASKDRVKAKESLSKAYDNYSNGSNQDYDVLQESKSMILENTDDVDSKIEILRENVVLTKNTPEVRIIEQLELADAYLEKGDSESAKTIIADVKEKKELIIEKETEADLYRSSSDALAMEGKYAEALNEYQNYQDVQTKILKEKEGELDKKLALLENQKNIEISEETYSSRRKLSESERRRTQIQQFIIYLLSLLLLISIIGVWYVYKNLRVKNKLNKKLELQSLRSQMNPHFIFNALNSVNEFISTQDERKANKYLSDFSKLMRLVLELSQKETIPLAKELELARIYTKLEHDRFGEKFEYQINIDPSLENSDLAIPPLILQPYLENAVWHGLRYKDHPGHLNLEVLDKIDHVLIRITDDGIGRSRSLGMKTKHQKLYKSTGLKNTAQRLKIIEDLYKNTFTIDIQDLDSEAEDKGTEVQIRIGKIQSNGF